MTNLKRQPGLIRIASAVDLAGGNGKGAGRRVSIRAGLYGLGALISLSVLAWRLYDRPMVSLAFTRERTAFISRLPDGRHANLFRLHAINNADQPMAMAMEVLEGQGIELVCGSCQMPQPPYSDAYHNVLLIAPSNSPKHEQTVVLRHKLSGERVSLTLMIP